jgi:uncharacterized damage-inducible protein DinB
MSTNENILLHTYASYNLWAHKLILDALEADNTNALYEYFNGSFTSVYATLLHIYDAESVWWQRINEKHPVVIPSSVKQLPFQELKIAMTDLSENWKKNVLALNEETFKSKFKYFAQGKGEFNQPLGDLLIHIFNHSTFHRGQIITLMRSFGIRNIPKTDFIDYSRIVNHTSL